MEEAEEANGALEDLFTNKQYVEKRIHVGGDTDRKQSLRLNVLEAATTDHDLTGQVVWPGARLLADYLLTLPESRLRGKSAVEIGSGAGLVGLVCGQFCDVTLTDHNPIILELLEENAGLNPTQFSPRCVEMDWENQQHVQSVLQSSPHGQGFDLVLGADICYGLKAVPYIFRTFAALLSHRQDSLGLLGYVSRAAAIDRMLVTQANEAGLWLVPTFPMTDVGGGLKGTVFHISWLKRDADHDTRKYACHVEWYHAAIAASMFAIFFFTGRRSARSRQ